MNILLNSKRAVTLAELMIAVGIMSLLFGALGYMVLVTGRNTLLVTEQARSQNEAAAATERIAALVRNASEIKTYGADDKSTTLTRIIFDTPNSATGTVSSSVIAFVPPSGENESDGVIKIFMDATKYKPGSVATDKADYEYEGIQIFGINYRTSTWMTINTFYSYRGYINFAAKTKDNNLKMAGEFVTDIIAKNHHPGKSGHYGETTSSVFLL